MVVSRQPLIRQAICKRCHRRIYFVCVIISYQSLRLIKGHKNFIDRMKGRRFIFTDFWWRHWQYVWLVLSKGSHIFGIHTHTCWINLNKLLLHIVVRICHCKWYSKGLSFYSHASNHIFVDRILTCTNICK